MKPYRSFNDFSLETFGRKVVKYSLDGNFSCPNRDGTLASGGCIFCGSAGAGEFTSKGDLKAQIDFQKELLAKKWKDNLWIAYFQNFTNTYAPVEILKERFEPLLCEEGCVGLAVATRGDCLSKEILDYLEELSQRTFFWLELGLQSIHEKSIKFLRRGYSHQRFEESVAELKKRKIRTLVHVIFGIPTENKEEMLQTVQYVSDMNLWGIKIHNLYIQRDTDLYKLYEKNPFPLLEQEEYVDLVVKALEILPFGTVIHRLTGDPPRRLLIAPKWSTDKLNTLYQIEKNLKARNSRQGKKWKGEER